MKKALILVTIATAFSQLAKSQKTIFSDDFSSNANKWPTYTANNINYLVYNGKYVVDIDDSLTYCMTIPVKIDTTKNYTISATMVHTSGALNAGYGIYFGGSDLKNYYTLDISGNGYYRLDLTTAAAGYSTIVPWTSSAAIKQGNYVENEVKLVKDGASWKIMINGQLVNTVPCRSFMGNLIGFVKNLPLRIEFDNLKVEQ